MADSYKEISTWLYQLNGVTFARKKYCIASREILPGGKIQAGFLLSDENLFSPIPVGLTLVGALPCGWLFLPDGVRFLVKQVGGEGSGDFLASKKLLGRERFALADGEGSEVAKRSHPDQRPEPPSIYVTLSTISYSTICTSHPIPSLLALLNVWLRGEGGEAGHAIVYYPILELCGPPRGD